MLTLWVIKMRWDCFVVENVENSTRGLRHFALHPFLFFEIIRVTGNCKDRIQKCCVLFAQLSQMVIFYITVVKSQNQQVHNSTMYIYFFVILSRMYLCSYRHNKAIDYSINTNTSLMQPLYSHFPAIPNLTSTICFHIYTFVISTMLYKWSHTYST